MVINSIALSATNTFFLNIISNSIFEWAVK